MELDSTNEGRIAIDSRGVGAGEPVFIIAEAGVNHNGKMDLAIRLIDAARDAGADAVKFQTFRAESLVAEGADKAGYQKETTGDGSQREMLASLELSRDDFAKLVGHARKRGLIFLSSPFDEESVELLEGLGVPAYKVASGELTNHPLLRHIASKGKPVILSTGMSTMEEVGEAVEAMRGGGASEIALLQCVTSYPADAAEVNLRAMDTMAREFGLPVGYSDHTTGMAVVCAAVARGACIIEKHLTLDRAMEGPDHRASMEPNDFREMAYAVREVEMALGSGEKVPSETEKENMIAARKSIVAKVDIPEGIIIERSMLAVMRPGTGLPPKAIESLVGKRSKTFIKSHEVITLDKLSE